MMPDGISEICIGLNCSRHLEIRNNFHTDIIGNLDRVMQFNTSNVIEVWFLFTK